MSESEDPVRHTFAREPFHSWCRVYIAGRVTADNDKHFAVQGKGVFTVVSTVYAYLTLNYDTNAG